MPPVTRKKQKVTCDFRGYGDTIVSACEKYSDAIEKLWKQYWRKQQEERRGTMTNEKAISVIENEIQIDVRFCTDEQVERFQQALYKAIDALRWRPTGEPLTLEQLREMGGKPYWHVGLQTDSPDPHWKILDPFVARCPEDYGYGKRWLAYAYPPAHIDREAWEPCGDCEKKSCDDCRYSEYLSYLEPCKSCEGASEWKPMQNFCGECGRPLTPESWDMLEKRLRR